MICKHLEAYSKYWCYITSSFHIPLSTLTIWVVYQMKLLNYVIFYFFLFNLILNRTNFDNLVFIFCFANYFVEFFNKVQFHWKSLLWNRLTQPIDMGYHRYSKQITYINHPMIFQYEIQLIIFIWQHTAYNNTDISQTLNPIQFILINAANFNNKLKILIYYYTHIELHDI